MPAAKLTLSPIEKGATWREVPMTWLQADGTTPNDLTGCTARMHIRRSVNSPDTLAELTTENGCITLGGTAGTIALALDAATTTALSGLGGVYDCEVVYPSGDVVRLFEGDIAFVPEVTR